MKKFFVAIALFAAFVLAQDDGADPAPSNTLNEFFLDAVYQCRYHYIVTRSEDSFQAQMYQMMYDGYIFEYDKGRSTDGFESVPQIRVSLPDKNVVYKFSEYVPKDSVTSDEGGPAALRDNVANTLECSVPKDALAPGNDLTTPISEAVISAAFAKPYATFTYGELKKVIEPCFNLPFGNGPDGIAYRDLRSFTDSDKIVMYATESNTLMFLIPDSAADDYKPKYTDLILVGHGASSEGVLPECRFATEMTIQPDEGADSGADVSDSVGADINTDDDTGAEIPPVEVVDVDNGKHYTAGGSVGYSSVFAFHELSMDFTDNERETLFQNYFDTVMDSGIGGITDWTDCDKSVFNNVFDLSKTNKENVCQEAYENEIDKYIANDPSPAASIVASIAVVIAAALAVLSF